LDIGVPGGKARGGGNNGSDIYQKICRFEKKEAGSSYNREYTPSLNAIIKETKAGVSYKDFGRKIEKIDQKRQELAASAQNLIHILGIPQNPGSQSIKDEKVESTYQMGSISKTQPHTGNPKTKVVINRRASHSLDPFSPKPPKKKSRTDIYGQKFHAQNGQNQDSIIENFSSSKKKTDQVEFERTLSGGGIGKFRRGNQEIEVAVGGPREGPDGQDQGQESNYGMVQKRARSVKEKKRLLEQR
jgi:hypothetical protein